MSKIGQLIIEWQEMWDEGIPLIKAKDFIEWTDAKERPTESDGYWYKQKDIEEYQCDDAGHLP